MVIAKEVQGAMNDEMGKMVLDFDALLGRLAANDAGGENDVAQRRHLAQGQPGIRRAGKDSTLVAPALPRWRWLKSAASSSPVMIMETARSRLAPGTVSKVA